MTTELEQVVVTAESTDGTAPAGPPSGFVKRLRPRLPRRQTLWVLLLLAILTWVILVPVGAMIWGSFRDGPPGTVANYTLEKYRFILDSPSLLRAVWNSVVFGGGAALLAFVLGTYLAWLTERTNVRFRTFIYVAVLFPLVVPGILTATSWLLLLSPRIGVVNSLAMNWLPFVDGPVFNGYSMLGMIWAEGSDSLTLPFLLMAAAFRSMDSSLEEASRISGAGVLNTTRRITLPVMLPAVLSTFILCFIKAIESFEVPAVLGIAARIPVFATQIWRGSQMFPSDRNLAAAFAVVYLIVVLIALAIYYRATRVGDRFATITGKGFRPTRIDLGRLRSVNTIAAMLILFLAVALPFLVMVYTSFLPFYEVPSAEVWGKMSFKQYAEVLGHPRIQSAAVTTIVIGVTASLLAVLLSSVVAWVTVRTQYRGRRLLDAIAFAPIALPGIVMALAMLWLYLTLPNFGIYATIWILILAFVAKFIPYGMRASHASLLQLNRELEEASQASGASWLRTMTQIVVPLIVPGLFVAFIYVLSLSVKILSLPIMLSGPKTHVLSLQIWEYYDGGFYPALNALGMLMFLLLLVLTGIAKLVANKVGGHTFKEQAL